MSQPQENMNEQEQQLENENPQKDNQQSFDPRQFREELQSENKKMMENLISNISTMVDSRMSSLPNQSSNNQSPQPVTDDDDLEDLKSHMDQIGVDEDQLKGIVNVVDKLLKKRGSGFEKDILNKVDQNLNIRETKREYTQKTASAYPQILDHQSQLFKMSKQVYNEMSEAMRQAPDAEASAVERAAARLGIQPVSVSSIKANDALNPTGEGGSAPRKKNKEVDADFASFFNIDPKKVNEKMKLVKTR